MAYIGNTPAENYASFLTETFTVSATTNYTLSHAVTNENEIRLVINGVVQQPGSGKAYTASGTTLTLSSATASGDSMYAVYLGRALQTVNPPNASVGNSQTAPTIITGQTAETSIATDDTILIHDTSASALRKMTRANFVSGIGGTNTPAFLVSNTANNTGKTDNAYSKMTYNVETFDTNSAFDISNNKFTVPTGEAGKYYFSVTEFLVGDSASCVDSFVNLYKNGSNAVGQAGNDFDFGNYSPTFTAVLDLAAGDYIEVYCKVNTSSGTWGQYAGGIWQGFKLIT
jgi:hypothetical protein